MRSFSKKFLSVFLSLITVLTVAFGTNIFAYADASTTTSLHLDYKKVVDVPNYNSTVNVGGMCAGTANNRLFVVKSNGDENNGVLFYYSNIYNPSSVKRIKFTKELLGHANGMAVDDNYVYVTMWKSDGSEKISILQINRQAISAMPDGHTISKVSETYNGINVCRKFYPINLDGSQYSASSINAIAKYSYDSVNKKTTFIFGAGNYDNRKILIYKKAVLDHNTNSFVVQSDKYYVKNPTTVTIHGEPKSTTLQDIFYDKEYGLFIPIWHGHDYQDGAKTYGRNNSVLQVDLNRETELYTIQSGGRAGQTINVINPTYLNLINSGDTTLKKFELESMCFIKKTSDKQSSTLRVMFTANMETKAGVGCDGVVEIINPSTEMKKL